MGCERERCACGPAAFRFRCPDWIPPARSKYARCAQFLESRTLCDLPTGSCRLCPLRITVPRPPVSQAERRRRYRVHRDKMRERMVEYRAMLRRLEQQARDQILGRGAGETGAGA